VSATASKLLRAAALIGALAAMPPSARAGEDAIDDPKVARRLGTRMDWGSAPPSSAQPASSAPALSSTNGPLAGAASLPQSVPPPVASSDATGQRDGDGAAAVVERTAAPPPHAGAGFSLPRLQIAFRRFDFVQIGAAGSSPGLAATEPFNSVSLDVYPVSSLIRLGLSTQYGWQSGTWTSHGDYFAAESVSAGAQVRYGRIVPFAEAFAGIGYMRRLQFDRTIPTAYWQLGVDLGADVSIASTGFVSLAVGYLHAVNGFLVAQQFTTAFLDTWSFKVGIGF
jgi:hypothetical protein